MARDPYPFDTAAQVIERFKTAQSREESGFLISFGNETGNSAKNMMEHPSVTKRKCIESLSAKGYPVEDSWVPVTFSQAGFN